MFWVIAVICAVATGFVVSRAKVSWLWWLVLTPLSTAAAYALFLIAVWIFKAVVVPAIIIGAVVLLVSFIFTKIMQPSS